MACVPCEDVRLNLRDESGHCKECTCCNGSIEETTSNEEVTPTPTLTSVNATGTADGGTIVSGTSVDAGVPNNDDGIPA